MLNLVRRLRCDSLGRLFPSISFFLVVGCRFELVLDYWFVVRVLGGWFLVLVFLFVVFGHHFSGGVGWDRTPRRD